MEFLSSVAARHDVIQVDDDNEDEDRKPAALEEICDLTQEDDTEEPQHVPPVASWATADAGGEPAESPNFSSFRDQSTTTTGRVKKRKSREEHDADYQLALKLQNEECSKLTAGEEEQEMYSSDFGQAWKLVERILQLHERLNDERAMMSVVAVDDMVFTAERFLKTVGAFALDDKPLLVDVGYHYTTPENLSRIRTDGLLSKTEREKQSIQARHNGSAYGDGIYTAKTPFAFLHHRYGETGLLVVRLAGNCSNRRPQRGYDSVLVNQGLPNEFTVLGTSGQCLPLFTYVGSSISPLERGHPGNSKLFKYAAEIQVLINQFLNEVNLNPGDLRGLFDDGLPNDSNPLPVLASQPAVAPTPPIRVPVPAPMPLSVPLGLHANPSQSHTQGPAVHPITFGAVPPLNPAVSAASSMHVRTLQHASQAHLQAIVQASAALHVRSLQHATQAMNLSSHRQAMMPQPPPRTKNLPQAPKVSPSRPIVIHDPAPPPLRTKKRSRKTECTLLYTAPESLDDEDFKGICRPMRQGTYSILSAECSVCLDVLMKSEHNGKIVRLIGCGHLFHSNCLRQSFKCSRSCPVCRKRIGAPRGEMPSGTMCVKVRRDVHCGGYPTCGSFRIDYLFNAEPQKGYHPTPGHLRPAGRRTAYLPNNDEGKLLLSRLKYAFSRGLTFKIGTSLTTGKGNRLTWAAIPHKTDPISGGEFGFPDANYFKICHDKLDGLGVPTDTTGFA